MFKYKIKVVGSEHKLYHIYRKKKWRIFWEDAGIVFTNKDHAQCYIDEMHEKGFSWSIVNAKEIFIRVEE